MPSSDSPAAPVGDVVLEAVGLTKHFPVRKRVRDLFSGMPPASTPSTTCRSRFVVAG
jgi:peptide/nickel transport system ATP-binding protein